jgi:hypothetical protein
VCDDVAGAIIDAIIEHAEPSGATCGAPDGEDHEWVVTWDDDERKAFVIDIPARVYEEGSGYSWKKKHGVVLEPSDIVVDEVRYEDIADLMGE